MTQQQAFDTIIKGGSVFLTGEPGSGKTYTINRLIEYFASEGIAYAVTASTGIAATHISGQTIHSWCGFGIKTSLTEAQLWDIAEKPWLQRIGTTDVLIIDEISMLEAGHIDMIDQVLRFMKRKTWGAEKPFGGVQMIFVGDFFQLPPVVKDGRMPRYAFESEAWKKLNPQVCYLTEQHRQSDSVFLEILTALRQNTLTDKHKQILKDTQNHKNPIETDLYTHVRDVDYINNGKLEELDGTEYVFYMKTKGNKMLVEYMKKSCLSPETLRLKVGATVMFTRNNFDEGYVNGTLGVVEEFRHGEEVAVRAFDGNLYIARPAEWTMEKEDASITQIPLRLAWAITVHKSQGISLDQANMNLSKCFEFGQGYVAISRVRTLAGLTLKGVNPKAYQMNPKIIEQDKIFREKSSMAELALIVDDTVTDVYIDTPDGWKCDRPGCTSEVLHKHSTYPSLK